jgi:hypothetical protein
MTCKKFRRGIFILISSIVLISFSFFVHYIDLKIAQAPSDIINNSSNVDQYEYSWNVTWGGSYDDSAQEVATDSLNNVYIVGWTDLSGSDNCDIIILKYDGNGTQEWAKFWRGRSDDKALNIYIDPSNNIYVCGYTKSLGDANGDIIIIKFDSSGNEIWNKTWGGNQYEVGTCIIEDSGGNFYISGLTSSFGDLDGDACLIKFNSNFEEEWNATWGGSEIEIANKVAIDSNGHLYVVGHSESLDPSPGESDVFILKYDRFGNLEWERSWGTTYSQRGNSLAIDSKDNIYVTGYSFGHPASSGKGYLLKYDANGNYQWERIWGVNGEYGNYFYRIIIDTTDGLYISGCTKTYGIYNNYDTLLLNYDTSGNQNWYKVWTGSGFDATPGICMDSDSNIFLVGQTDTNSAGAKDMLLIKYAFKVDQSPNPPDEPIIDRISVLLFITIGVIAAIAVPIIIIITLKFSPKKKGSKRPYGAPPMIKKEYHGKTAREEIPLTNKMVQCPYCSSWDEIGGNYCGFCGTKLHK